MTEGISMCPPASQATGEDVAGIALVVFRIDGREHALSVADVVEVVRMVRATPLPDAPAWVLGVISFRGRVIPLIDVGSRLGARPRPPDLSTPIIVVQSGQMAAGLVVDAVLEVRRVAHDALTLPGRVTAAAPAVTAVVRESDRLILVLDWERLFEGFRALALSGDEEMT